jgi:hemerythrin-like domain-containing protein
MHKALSIIHDEHRSLSAVLSGLKSLAQLALDPEVCPDFAVFRAMVHYIDTFPERVHHPKEDQFLFARLAERDPDSGQLIDALKAEHVAGARLIRDLESALLEFEQRWPRGAAQFAAKVTFYAQFHWNHMRREESQLLPRAERFLHPEDWQAIEAAFTANQDPMASADITDVKALYQRILCLAPDPVGLGERWKKPPVTKESYLRRW